MPDLIRSLEWPASGVDADALLAREWLVTNGLGGYASGTVASVPTRRYHGLLTAALPAPLGRISMLADVSEQVELEDSTVIVIGGQERVEGDLELPGVRHLSEFRLEMGLPVWRYEIGSFVLERRLLMPYQQNSVHLIYRLVRGDGSLRLRVRPAMQFRPHEAPVDEAVTAPYRVSASADRYEVSSSGGLPPLRLHLSGQESSLTLDGGSTREVFYRIEASRGYKAHGQLWSPGWFQVELAAGGEAALLASTDPWEIALALGPREALEAEQERRSRLLAAATPSANTGLAAELVLAADQFVITPSGRTEDAARARAVGDEVRTVIAGYHWFTEWGRDTMISLEGLTLTTGRRREASSILRTFAHYVRDGLIPNVFPEGEKQGLYHTADASLWFFHAVDRYLRLTDDHTTLRVVLPRLREIVDRHLSGTHFGIGVDPRDGLLRQGADGYQLTWMDAKVGDWVVTPRRGKAVEINALWYNALRLLEGWIRAEGDEAAAHHLSEQAQRAYVAFNQRFWYEAGGYLYDVVDGAPPAGPQAALFDGSGPDDPACRPNQLLAISLSHPILAPERWEAVLKVAVERLVTPLGLRSLAPSHPDYHPKYFGDLRARDAAYHQGTVWAWLFGPLIDAWLKVHPGDRAGARRFLDGFDDHLDEACIGSISEIFDADPPFTPRGCAAQAWSVAEVLRCLALTADEMIDTDPV